MLSKLLLLAFILYQISSHPLESPSTCHSFNDLPLLRQNLLKGMRYFKNDISLADKSSCETHSTWNSSLNECIKGDSDIIVDTCCYAMRGDCSGTPYFNYEFNTTYDFVDFLRDPQNKIFFEKNSPHDRYSKQIFWEFDIQQGYAANPIVEIFLYDLFKAINDLDLNIQMSYDSYQVEQFQYLCFQLKNCTEKQQYIADQFIVIQTSYSGQTQPTSDIIDPTGKFKSPIQQFNTAFTNIGYLCQNFPNWFQNFTYGMTLWEPSFSYSAFYLLDQFYSPNCHMSSDYNPDRNPLKLVSNQSPEMIESFIQPINSTQYPQYGQKLYWEGNTDPIVASLISQNVTFIAFQSQGQQIVKTLTNELTPKILSQIIFEETIIKIKTSGDYIVLQSQEHLYVYKEQIQKEAILHQIQINQDFIDSILFIDSNKQPYLLVLQRSANNKILYYVIQVNGDDTYCFHFLEYDLSVLDSDNYDFQGGYNSKLQQLEVLLTYSAENSEDYSQKVNVIMAATFVISKPITSKCTIKEISENSQINFGVRPRGTTFSTSDSLNTYFAIVFSDSMCQSGVEINNNGWNKCNLYKHEEFIGFVNVKNQLSYMYGSFSYIQERIKNKSLITECDSKIIVSKFFQGNTPTIAIILKGEDNYHVLVSHNYVNYDDFPITSNLFCGTGYYEAGYKTNQGSLSYSFQIVNPKLFDTVNQQQQAIHQTVQ